MLLVYRQGRASMLQPQPDEDRLQPIFRLPDRRHLAQSLPYSSAVKFCQVLIASRSAARLLRCPELLP